jgi:hypothetical protein
MLTHAEGLESGGQMRTAATLLALLMAMALAACAELRWQKDGADAATLASALSACRKLAQERTQRMWGVAPQPTVDPRFGPGGPSPTDLRLQESQAVSTCMREKGYSLVPADR